MERRLEKATPFFFINLLVGYVLYVSEVYFTRVPSTQVKSIVRNRHRDTRVLLQLRNSEIICNTSSVICNKLPLSQPPHPTPTPHCGPHHLPHPHTVHTTTHPPPPRSTSSSASKKHTAATLRRNKRKRQERINLFAAAAAASLDSRLSTLDQLELSGGSPAVVAAAPRAARRRWRWRSGWRAARPRACSPAR